MYKLCHNKGRNSNYSAQQEAIVCSFENYMAVYASGTWANYALI